MKAVAILTLFLGVTSAAHAATMVQFTGNDTGALATATASISLGAGNNSITGSLTNTSPNDARITGFGFDIGPGNLSGFTGSPNPIIAPAGVSFAFVDSPLGNVPQFNAAELDFGYVTGPNFAGGSPNSGLDNGQTLQFMISGAFSGLTEAQVASGMIVRFQRVGPNGEGSDVAVANGSPGVPTQFSSTPEPASMILLGSGLALLASRFRSVKT